MRVVLFSKFTAQTGCSINAPSGLPVKGPCSARCFGENGGFWADMGAGVPLTGLGGSDFLPSGINTQPPSNSRSAKRLQEGLAVTVSPFVYTSEFCIDLDRPMPGIQGVSSVWLSCPRGWWIGGCMVRGYLASKP